MLLLAALGIGVVVWYFFPLMTLDAQHCSVPEIFEDGAGHDGQVTGIGFKHLVVGWFHGMQPLDRKTNVLILGFDEGGKSYSGRTDVIIVAEVDPAHGIEIISIPRDLWVAFPTELMVDGVLRNADMSRLASSDSPDDRTHNRINAVHRLGNRYFGKGMGLHVLKKVLKDELGLSVDYTVAVGYEGVREIIDMVGGITVDVPCPIRDNFISPTSPSGYEMMNVAAGVQQFSGHQALLYMRSRHGRTDMDRSKRQQLVLKGLRARVMSERNFFALPRLVAHMLKFVKTDADVETILQLATTARRLQGRLYGMVMGAPVVSAMETPDGRRVLVLNREKYLERRKKRNTVALTEIQTHRAVCARVDAALNWRNLKPK
jgi:polyisoprenyl-teichoic acid--peptidoglycan teichoic acid transferase